MFKITSFKDLKKYFEISDEVISFMESLTKDTEANKIRRLLWQQLSHYHK